MSVEDHIRYSKLSLFFVVNYHRRRHHCHHHRHRRRRRRLTHLFYSSYV